MMKYYIGILLFSMSLSVVSCHVSEVGWGYKNLGKRYHLEQDSIHCALNYYSHRNGEPLGGKFRISNNSKIVFASFENGLLQDTAYTYSGRKRTKKETFSNGILNGDYISSSSVYNPLQQKNISMTVKATYRNGLVEGNGYFFMDDTLVTISHYHLGIKSGKEYFVSSNDTVAILEYECDSSITSFPKWYRDLEEDQDNVDVLGRVRISTVSSEIGISILDIMIDFVFASDNCNSRSAYIVSFDDNEYIVLFVNNRFLRFRQKK